MPLARIVTSTPEYVASLSEYLRSRGYTVELVDPGTLRNAPADLELNVLGCSSEEAMSRAREAAESAGSGRQAIAYDITGRPVEFADEQDEPRAGGNAIAHAWQGVRSAGQQILDDFRLEGGRLREWLAEGRRSIEEYRRGQHRRRQAVAQAEEKQRERAAQRQAGEAERLHRQQQESARRAELAAAQERARRQQQQEQAQRQQQAERERRLVERYRQEAQRDAVQERFQVEQGEARQKVAAAETTVTRREPQRPEPRRSQRDGDWTKAAVAIGLALLATLGYAAYQNRQPAAPLSNRDLVRSQSVSQPVPFGTATVPPPPANGIGPAATLPSAQGNTTTSGRDARQGVSLPQSDPAATAPPAPARAARKRVARRSSSYQDDPIADDEVIVHRSGSRTTQARTNPRTEPRHISDLEQ